MGVKKKSEPENISGLVKDEVVVDILRNAGWLEFLEKFEGFQEDIVDEFLCNLRDN